MKAGTEMRETKFDRTFEMLPCFNTHAKPWHFPSKDGLCVSSAHVPSGYVRDFKRQAAELRKTGREAARGFKRKNDGVFQPKLPLSSLLLCCLYFHLAP